MYYHVPMIQMSHDDSNLQWLVLLENSETDTTTIVLREKFIRIWYPMSLFTTLFIFLFISEYEGYMMSLIVKYLLTYF
jgi:hypothetical protein